VTLVPDAHFTPGTSAELSRRLERVLPQTTIEIVAVERIEREHSGKYRIVASEVPCNA
jgi:hypothetical protein